MIKLPPELLNDTELKESWKKMERNVLGESKLFKSLRHKPTGISSGVIMKDNVQFSTKNVGLAVIRTNNYQRGVVMDKFRSEVEIS